MKDRAYTRTSTRHSHSHNFHSFAALTHSLIMQQQQFTANTQATSPAHSQRQDEDGLDDALLTGTTTAASTQLSMLTQSTVASMQELSIRDIGDVDSASDVDSDDEDARSDDSGFEYTANRQLPEHACK